MSQDNVKYEFTGFGKNCELVAIFMILNLIPYVSFATGFLSLIFMFMALGNIKNVNIHLNNRFLYEFRGQYITSFVLSFIGLLFFMGGLIGMVFTLIYAGLYGLFLLIPMFLGVLIMIGSGVVEMKAWENLKNFFHERKDLFPEPLWREVVDGCDKLKTAALMNVLGFLLITLFIGFILRAVGYFKLGKLKQLGFPYIKPAPTQAYAPPQPAQPAVKFCPNCGSPIKGNEKFCGTCSSEL